MSNNQIKTFLIGGPPGAGKTTLGSALAAKLGFRSLTIDDIKTAVLAVTTPETHPGLHAMSRLPFLEYCTDSSVEQLKIDTMLQHEAVWASVKRVIRKHAMMGDGIVIDGWHLLPSRVAELKLDNVWTGWIFIEPEVLEAREKSGNWYQNSSNPERMFENFMARSLWFNTLMKEEASRLNMNILYQDGNKSVDDLCNMVLENSQKEAR